MVMVSRRAHPRECGADAENLQHGDRYTGSSPRVRGRPSLRIRRTFPSGLIPASAGQTTSPVKMIRIVPAHPRECGADPVGWRPAVKSEGSSPRVRGRHCPQCGTVCLCGLIPASAGQTCMNRPSFFGFGAHPRECGADTYSGPVCMVENGSSPRVRGRPAGTGQIVSTSGLIPASAGQTARDVVRATGR